MFYEVQQLELYLTYKIMDYHTPTLKCTRKSCPLALHATYTGIDRYSVITLASNYIHFVGLSGCTAYRPIVLSLVKSHLYKTAQTTTHIYSYTQARWKRITQTRAHIPTNKQHLISRDIKSVPSFHKH